MVSKIFPQALKVSIALIFFVGSPVVPQAHNWNSPSEVVKKIKKKFSNIKSYTAEFRISTVNNKKTTNLRGNCFYKAPGKVRYDFKEPEGDAIVSDGKTLWIYIKRIGAVGKQDLELKKNNSSGPIFQAASAEGLNRLFRKYHYKFESINQPQVSPKDGKPYFVLALEQREKIGGYENMILFVDAETYLIKKAVAADGRGKESTMEFTSIQLDTDIEDGVFNYHISGNAKIVNNPLVSEN